jgi:hypothetical protein
MINPKKRLPINETAIFIQGELNFAAIKLHSRYQVAASVILGIQI